jgi:ABC-2 type transport system permease protein
MLDEKLIWKERFSRTSKELSRYLRYIFNGHIVIVFVFLIGTAAYYYQEWLKTLPEEFPVPIIMALLLSIILTYSPIYTFLSEADRIFLLPLEMRLGGYFTKSLLISFVLQLYLLLIGYAVLMPMYAAVHQGSYQRFLPFLLVLIIVKGLNVLIRWRVQYYIETNVHRTDSFVRFMVNVVFLYLLFSNGALYFTVPIGIILFLLYLYYKQQTKGKGLKWELLIDQDERRMTSFYRLANLFTDVPKLKDRIKRRKWLDSIINRLPYQQKNAYTYLYLRTFARAGDYLGLMIRLTIIGALAIYFLSYGIGQVLIVVLFLYLTGFQLLPLWKHHQNKLWIDLYPLNSKLKEASFLGILNKVLWVQSFLLSLVVLLKGDYLVSLISFIAGITFTGYFVSIYSKGKIQKIQ